MKDYKVIIVRSKEHPEPVRYKVNTAEDFRNVLDKLFEESAVIEIKYADKDEVE